MRSQTAPGKHQCPFCPKKPTHREILRHINEDHFGIATDDQLKPLGAYRCECGQARSCTNKGRHICPPAGSPSSKSGNPDINKRSSSLRSASVPSAPRTTRGNAARLHSQADGATIRQNSTTRPSNLRHNISSCSRTRKWTNRRKASCSSDGSDSNYEPEEEALRRLLESPARSQSQVRVQEDDPAHKIQLRHRCQCSSCQHSHSNLNESTMQPRRYPGALKQHFQRLLRQL